MSERAVIILRTLIYLYSIHFTVKIWFKFFVQELKD
jgi:hypothetical protein